MRELLGMPVAAATHADQIDQIIVIVHWLMAVLFVGWGLFFLYTLVRFRAGAHPKASYQSMKGTVSKVIEGGVLAAEILILVSLSMPAWAERVEAFPPEKDVIHSFGLPQMRVKQDAIPGIVHNLWFTPSMTGEWEVACSQLCGLGHYRMRGFYTIQSDADFEAFLKENAPTE
jgi:heme/copper-type cytochrome/quinol oxidase subunit 2